MCADFLAKNNVFDGPLLPVDYVKGRGSGGVRGESRRGHGASSAEVGCLPFFSVILSPS